ncbi:hypothetical protein [Aliagarivorans taiwanensis]|uniref:hypothetical protein n=1 Tax=Aliagarivorans taiwanensis TaxID=561966 RepID=UPI00041EAAC0|nr:hypothetical protein [Aliagarivorans taiwanensis]
MKHTIQMGLLASIVAITGCTVEDDKFTDEDVARAVECSNQNGRDICRNPLGLDTWGVATLSNGELTCRALYCVSPFSEVPEYPGLTVWDVENRLIPVYFLDQVDKRFNYALDQVELAVGRTMFERHGVINLNIDAPTDIDYSRLDSGGGIIFSQATAVCNDSVCSSSNVSTAPYSDSIPRYITTDYQKIWRASGHGFVWVNLDAAEYPGSDTMVKTASENSAIHELAHVLGMHSHFDGFSRSEAWSHNASRVLKTMYYRGNPPGVPYFAMYIR